MEHVKDFLFDLSDILISLVIVALIFTVVSWKLNETIPISFSLFEKDARPQTTEPVTKAPSVAVVIDGSVPDTNSEITNDTVITPSDGNAVAPSEEPVTTPDTAIKIAPLDATETDTAKSEATPKSTKKITVEIPAGSSGDGIARILKNKGLITDIKLFNRTIETMGLGNKLRAGTFKISQDMSVESIIKLIANQK